MVTFNLILKRCNHKGDTLKKVFWHSMFKNDKPTKVSKVAL